MKNKIERKNEDCMEENVDASKSGSAGKIVIAIFIVLGAFFLLIGIGMIISGVVSIKHYNTDDYVEIKAVISKIESDSDSDGEDYHNGASIEVLVNVDDYSDYQVIVEYVK